MQTAAKKMRKEVRGAQAATYPKVSAPTFSLSSASLPHSYCALPSMGGDLLVLLGGGSTCTAPFTARQNSAMCSFLPTLGGPQNTSQHCLQPAANNQAWPKG